jgi:hypothetical protein
MVTISLLATSFFAPIASGATNSYLTTGVTQSGIEQKTINVSNGVLVNYTSTYSSSLVAFVYLDLTNSAGQTIYWDVASCTFAANQKVQCFVVIAATVPKGNYSASVFAATTSSVPLSTTSSVQVTI